MAESLTEGPARGPLLHKDTRVLQPGAEKVNESQRTTEGWLLHPAEPGQGRGLRPGVRGSESPNLPGQKSGRPSP